MISSIKKLLGVNVFVQIMGLMIYPMLLAFYSLEELAIYGMLYGAMAIFSILLSCRIENLFFTMKLREAYSLYSFYVKYIYSSILVLFIIFYFFFKDIDNNFIINLIIAIVCGSFLAGFNVTYNILVRLGNEKYNLLKIIRSFLELIFVIIAISIKTKISLLFLFVGFTYFIVCVYSFIIGFYYKGRVGEYKEYFRLVSLDMISSLMNTSYLYSPNYFLYFGSNKNLSGYYFIINRFFVVPSIMIAQSMGTALKQYLAGKTGDRYRHTLNNFNSNIFSKFYKIYIILSISLTIVVYIFDLFKYDQLIYVFLIILPLMIFRFNFLVYSCLFYVLKDYLSYVKLQSLLFFVGLVSFAFGWILDNSWISLLIYSMFSIFIYKYFVYKVFNKVPSI